MFVKKFRIGLRIVGVGIGITSSYFTVQYQKTVGIKSDRTVSENIAYMQEWMKWQFMKTVNHSKDWVAQCCHDCSISPWFHYLDLTLFLIYLANRENLFVHDLGVKLLAAVKFPLDTDTSKYIKQCKYPVMVGLARSTVIDSKWFSPTETKEFVIYDDKIIQGKIDNILTVIKTVLGEKAHDTCSLWLFERVVQNILPPDPIPNVMNDLSVGRDDTDFSSEYEIEFSEHVSTYLEILRRYSNKPDVIANGAISWSILDVLLHISHKFEENSSILVACGNIIANLAINKTNRDLIIKSDILNLLLKWKQSPFVSVQITTSRILNNLDLPECTSSQLCEGIYVLHPENRSDYTEDIDIVFIHGIRGSPFYTWRQKDPVNNGYTYCWPKDWLSLDYPNSRIISVEYNSHLSDWLLSCPLEKEDFSIDKQAEKICKKLKECGVGKKPTIWVTHSMGGLIVKKMLVDFEDDDMVDSTEGIVFFSVPHLGSPIATHSEKASYILFPSTEVNELSENSEKLKKLHYEFAGLLKRKHIECVDFGETQALTLPYLNIKCLVVPEHSSRVGYGHYVEADSNHQDICKPLSKTDEKYTVVVELIDTILKKHVPFKK